MAGGMPDETPEGGVSSSSRCARGRRPEGVVRCIVPLVNRAPAIRTGMDANTASACTRAATCGLKHDAGVKRKRAVAPPPVRKRQLPPPCADASCGRGHGQTSATHGVTRHRPAAITESFPMAISLPSDGFADAGRGRPRYPARTT